MLLVGPGLARDPRRWTKWLCASGRLVLVSEPRVWRLYGRRTSWDLGRARLKPSLHLLPEGEKAKTWSAVQGLLRAMASHGLARDSALLALGGGTVTDAAGFAAAVFMRGIPWVSLPTTLLGQVDAGLGGKTAVDLPAGKNLAGAFHEPRAVVCDTDFLGSLSSRDVLCGLAEALKLGLVHDPALARRLRRDWPRLMAKDRAALSRCVRRAATGKLAVVRRDPREAKGVREVLNFGHTIGHALEAAAGFGPLRHGEAIIYGMRAALLLSRLHAGLAPAKAADWEAFLRGLPVPKLSLSRTAVLCALRRDKKARRGRLRFVLLKDIGRPLVTDRVSGAGLRQALRLVLEERR